jgi:hypothetical protein
VSDAAFDLHILILSEDSGSNGVATVRELARCMLRLVDRSYQEKRVEFEPDGEEAQRAMHRNGYLANTPDGRRKRVILARDIARHIFNSRGIVLLHVDADQAWKDRATPSKLIRDFHDVTTVNVSRVVDDLLAKNQSTRGKEDIMSSLCLVAPYWCIESWLYQNTVVAGALCHMHYSGRDADRFEHWKQHRDELDDVDKPKAQICLHDKFNHDLASQGFPSRAVDEVGKSFHETVERLRSSPALVAALAATHPNYS